MTATPAGRSTTGGVAPADVTTPYIGRIDLTDFRNYERLTLETGPGPVVLTGPNGAGKTNLLEAISLLAPGRGLRRAALKELDRAGGGPWQMRASIDGTPEPALVETGRQADEERRYLRLDGESSRIQSSLAGLLGVVWLTPVMDRLFNEGASGRRRYLDRLTLTVYPDHARHVTTYERTLRERSLVLRQGRSDPAWLTALERRLAEHALAIAAARRELVLGLDAVLASESFAEPAVSIAVRGEVERWLDEGSALDAEHQLTAALAASRGQDAITGGAAHGPHRSDLEVGDRHTGEPAARCSTGRQKAMLFNITMAEVQLRRLQHGDLPIVLLDEVAAHLDGRRRDQLAATLTRLGAQAWLTGTDPDLFAGLRGKAQFHHVDQGRMTRND